jgi:hypothetical protein
MYSAIIICKPDLLACCFKCLSESKISALGVDESDLVYYYNMLEETSREKGVYNCEFEYFDGHNWKNYYYFDFAQERFFLKSKKNMIRLDAEASPEELIRNLRLKLVKIVEFERGLECDISDKELSELANTTVDEIFYETSNKFKRYYTDTYYGNNTNGGKPIMKKKTS